MKWYKRSRKIISPRPKVKIKKIPMIEIRKEWSWEVVSFQNKV